MFNSTHAGDIPALSVKRVVEHGRALLVGMGNPILSDDAIGVRLAKDFRQRLESRGDLGELDFIEECSVGGLNIISLIENYDKVVVLDSIKTGRGQPGDWIYFTAEALRETMNLRNVHDMNFATALELGRRLGHRIPPDSEIHVFAVEVADTSTFSESLTPTLDAAYADLSAEIYAAVLARLSA